MQSMFPLARARGSIATDIGGQRRTASALTLFAGPQRRIRPSNPTSIKMVAAWKGDTLKTIGEYFAEVTSAGFTTSFHFEGDQLH